MVVRLPVSSASDYSAGCAAGASARPGSGSGSADRPYVTAGSYGAGGVRPSDAAQALAFVSAGLEFLAHDDAALWPEGLQADCLRVLAAAQSRQVAAHARVLAAFSVPGGGLSGDGHRSPRVWLSWQCQATARAAAAQVGWMRRLGRHPRLAAALAEAMVSESWARQLIAWSDRLPEEHRDDADGDLLAAAGLGADLAGLAGLAEELRREHAAPDDGDDGFADRRLRLGRTFEGAGRMEGDLTPRCAQAAQAVLAALSQRRGPEDDRTLDQRQHDALEEAFIRLIAADGMLPRRGGEPVRLGLDITLAELTDGDADGDTCDAVVQPVITGMTDYGLLAKLADPGSDEAQALQAAAAAAAASAAAAPFGDALEAAVRLLCGPRGYARMLRRRAAGAARDAGDRDQPAAGDPLQLPHRAAAPAPGRDPPGPALPVPGL